MITWPPELVADLEMRRAVLFLGSGVSRNSVALDGTTRPRAWEDFLIDAARQVGVSAEIAPYIASRDYLTALDLIRYRCSRDQYATIVHKEYLTPGYGDAKIHEIIYKLDAKMVLTPNFDKIYDVYAAAKSRGTIVVKQFFDLGLVRYIRGDKQIVIKIHGSVHCCPVNCGPTAMNARNSADFRAKDGVHDLKSAQAPGVVPGVSDEHRQNALRPTDGIPAVEDLQPDCRPTRRRQPGANAQLRRAIPGHGVRPADLSGKPAGY